MDSVAHRLGKNIKAWRKSRGLSQEQLAQQLGTKYQVVQRWEAGKALPQQTNLDKLCELAQLDIEYFFLNRSEPTEILRGPDVEAFKAFAKMLSAMGERSANPYLRIGTGRTPKAVKRSHPVLRIRTACG